MMNEFEDHSVENSEDFLAHIEGRPMPARKISWWPMLLTGAGVVLQFWSYLR